MRIKRQVRVRARTRPTARPPTHPFTHIKRQVCMAAEVQAVLVPCGHLCTCFACAAALPTCPLCRSRIRERVRTYF